MDRIYLVMEELGLFQKAEIPAPRVLFTNFGDEEAFFALKSVQELRRQGIRAELYPSAAKLKKQMNYANKKEIPYVVLIGEQELRQQNFTLKNMATGEQKNCGLQELLALLRS